jgi:hypothetical protein
MARGRPPKPTKVLELSGAFKKDPKRKKDRKNEPKPEGTIGPYPGDRAQCSQKDAYDLIVSSAPIGVLTPSDQPFVEEMARLLHLSWTNKATASERQLLMTGFGKIGMNPSERSRLHITKPEKPKNRWSDVG